MTGNILVDTFMPADDGQSTPSTNFRKGVVVSLDNNRCFVHLGGDFDADGNPITMAASIEVLTMRPWVGAQVMVMIHNRRATVIGVIVTQNGVPMTILGGTDASLSDTSGYLVLGPITGSNLVIDNNEIVSRNNGAADTLYLQAEGGGVSIGAAGSNTVLNGNIFMPNSNKILWGVSSGLYMHDGHNIPLSESVTSQATGIVLCWSYYSGSSGGNSFWTYCFVPKWHVQDHAGAGVSMSLGSGTTSPQDMISKYVYVSNTSIAGHAGNTTGLGTSRVLRAVIGV